MQQASGEFKVGDKAVYPNAGVTEVVNIMEREINGSLQRFYVLRVLNSTTERTVLVPVNSAATKGLRQVVSEEDIQEIFEILKEPAVAADTQSWNRRVRALNDKMNTGSIYDAAEVMRDLYNSKSEKSLSYSEKRMLENARSRIVKEISVARDRTEEQILEEIESIFSPN